MKLSKQLTKATLLFTSIFVFKIQAQNTQNPLITDRPDQTESASAMQKGILQIEAGSLLSRLKTFNTKTQSNTYATTLFRYGLFNNVELRLGIDFNETKIKQQNNTINNSSLSPLALGFKSKISAENGIFPQIAFLGHFELPFTVKSDFKPDHIGANFRFSFAHTLTEQSSFGYNLGVRWDSVDSKPNYEYTLVYGHTLFTNCSGYLELYGDVAETLKPSHLWNVGITYLLSDNFQLDASIGTGISNVQDLYLSAGFSVRIPNKNKKI